MKNQLPTDKLEFTIEYLRYLEDGGEPCFGGWGLCDELQNMTNTRSSWDSSAEFDRPPGWWINEWADHKGRHVYPVPDTYSPEQLAQYEVDLAEELRVRNHYRAQHSFLGPLRLKDIREHPAERMFDDMDGPKDFWAGDYGDLRREYCGHVADYLEHFRRKRGHKAD